MNAENNFRERLFKEYAELEIKVSKLKEFIVSDFYESLSEVDKRELKEQLRHMERYLDVLSRRVSRLCN